MHCRPNLVWPQGITLFCVSFQDCNMHFEFILEWKWNFWNMFIKAEYVKICFPGQGFRLFTVHTYLLVHIILQKSLCLSQSDFSSQVTSKEIRPSLKSLKAKVLNAFTLIQQQVCRLKESTTLSASLFYLSCENVIRASSTTLWRFLHPVKYPIDLWLIFSETWDASACCFLWTTSISDSETSLSQVVDEERIRVPVILTT